MAYSNEVMEAMPLPAAPARIEFIDLKAQYRAMKSEIDARIQKVLDHGAYIMGPEVEELESRLAAYTGAAHCITAASGTEALLISLMALGVGPGDEVITSPFTFISAAEVIVLLGATPVYVDVEADTGNIDARGIEEKVTSRTRAIIPVSLYGQPADMDEINAVPERHGIAVIEDAAQSFGATYKGRKSCNLSSIACTSFFPSKPLGCYGDGGAIFTSDARLAQAMRELRVHGQSRRYVHTRVGVGGRMDTLQCAIVLAKLGRFEWEVERRMRIGKLYDALLEGRIETMRQRPDRTSVFAQYTVKIAHRERVQKQLAELQIPTAVHYPVMIPAQPAYVEEDAASRYPVARQLCEQVMSLPMGPYMNDATVERVAEILSGIAMH